MWAQGLTIGVLIAAGVMTQSQRTQSAKHDRNVDHSWKNILEEQERERKEMELRLRAHSQPAATA